VDVNANPVAGALDLHVGDAGALQATGQKPPDSDVFLDIVGVLLVGVPPGLPVGGDTESEAVGIDLLAHYCEPPFLVAAVLLPCARRERLDCPTR
jgi:hypothetical protein